MFKHYRNIWLISVFAFIVSIVLLLVGVLNEKLSSLIDLSMIILILSIMVGSTSFLIWIFKTGNKFIKSIILVLFGLFLLLIIFASVLRFAIVDGKSMEPSFKDEEIFLVNKLSYEIEFPQRGDVVSYTRGEGTGECMGRIVGLPNEAILIMQSEVRVNGDILNEPYADWSSWVGNDKKEISLQSDEYLILLDKRTENADVVNKHDIIGKFMFKFWVLN